MPTSSAMSSHVTLTYIIKAKFRRKFLIPVLLWWLAEMIIAVSGWSSGTYPTLPVFEPKCSELDCHHGTCVMGNRCRCDFGWQGRKCDKCGGRIRYNSSFGYITDGRGNYSSDLQCTWLIDSETSNATIRLQLDFFETECAWDHLYIFDGDSVNAPMLAVLSGSLIKERRHVNRVPEITGRSGRVYLYFYSDAAYNMSGFNITYSINACPRNCSQHGVCVGDRCTCDAGYEGDACQTPICPEDCRGRGICDRNAHKCLCNFGYVGVDCGQVKHEGYWQAISATNMPAGRALHQAVIYEDTMFVIGGEHFSRQEPFLIKYDMKLKKWDQVERVAGAKNEQIEPEPRFGHSAVLFNHTIYVFGGILRNGTIVADLWQYHIPTGAWTRRPHPSLYSTKHEFCCPMPSIGHTATVVNNVMIVIFGYNPTLGYLNHVLYFNNLNDEADDSMWNSSWRLVKTTGVSVKGGFGHSSTYDHVTRLIYVFGGYHSSSFADNVLVDFLYAYDPKKESWMLLAPSYHPRYLHSASILNGLLLVFGGNGHNLTHENSAGSSSCFSRQFLAYDISCDTWRTLDEPVLSNSHDETTLGRYGHSSVVYDESLYIFGGFNGLMHNELMRYLPGNCSHFVTVEDCHFKRIGTKCIWNKEKRQCQSYGQVKFSQHHRHHHCDEGLRGNLTELCQRQTLCPSCLRNSYECVWCSDACYHKKCNPVKMPSTSKDLIPSMVNGGSGGTSAVVHPKSLNDAKMCESRDTLISNCEKMHNCHSCQMEHYCSWKHDRQCTSLMYDSWLHQPASDDHVECEAPCHTRTTCENCTQGSCMWCSSQRRCIESNAYSVIYPIGQCMEWTTHPNRCQVVSCRDIQSCDRCLKNPQCGWCDDGGGSGVGSCIEGSLQGPIPQSLNFEEPLRTTHCSNWFFTSCPQCQCNGHGVCLETPNVCSYCGDNTTGLHCEWCLDGFYGNPINGNKCTPCFCNGDSDVCDFQTGKCSCTTKGIIGHRCDKCDEANNYVGNPQEPFGSCYYNLSTSYSYTFNMSKADDRYFTRINFINTPMSPEIDVEFTIQCQESALVNISVGSSLNSTLLVTRRLNEAMRCGSIKLRFSYPDLGIKNATFFVSVYSFRTPFLLQISFSQHRNLDIIQFFLTFSGCFLTLLIIAALLWKIKQKYELWVRRQQLFVELEQMASRPFAGVAVQIKPETTGDSSFLPVNLNPSPIGLEPCANGNAAILTLLVKLPTGDQPVPPPGQTAIALASALVTLGPNRRKEDKEKCSLQKITANPGKTVPENASFSTGV